MRRLIFATLCLGLAASHADAGPNVYECTVKQYGRLDVVLGVERPISTSGPLVVGDPVGSGGDEAKRASNAWAKLYVGQTFNVDRPSGLVVGTIFSNIQANDRQVISQGSREESYRVLSISGQYRSVMLLSVAEFALGEVKPFLLTMNTEMAAGTCK